MINLQVHIVDLVDIDFDPTDLEAVEVLDLDFAIAEVLVEDIVDIVDYFHCLVANLL